MKNIKKNPKKQLEKFSNIFTQLGLVLVLFIVYVTLEHETVEKHLAEETLVFTSIIDLDPSTEFIYKEEVLPKPKVEAPPTSVFIPDAEIKKVDNKDEETLLIISAEPTVELDITTLITAKEPVDDLGPETVPYINIENAPVFKGCEGLTKEENKKCFDEKMLKFVQRNFDVGIASQVGLRSGKYRISTQFVIDDKGNVVDIQIRAPHAKLKKETQDLIEKLPQFTPGKQSNKTVRVKYTLPITFRVD